MSDPLPVPPPPFARTDAFSRFGSIEDIDAKYLQDNYLKGLIFVDADGKPYGPEWYAQKVNTGISRFEHATQMSLVPHLIEDETHDYYIKDYQLYAFIQLYHYPLIVTQEHPVVKAKYPTGQLVTTFPREWVRADAMHGQIQLIPTQGTLSQVILGQGGSYLPIIYQGLGYLPQLFNVTYKAGFEKGKVPQLFIDAVAKLAVMGLLSSVGDSVRPAGVTSQSFSIDGMSESRGFQNNSDFTPAFSGTISQIKRELFGDERTGDPGLLKEVKDFYRGINMVVTA